ncbi:hypothetical protein [Thermomonas sp.]|uniref:hypothetical protein n=1 Tax=Thermomonas sp. TaxID=1971895 RepID=UPI0024870A38|nr:hypothetical protein [Thermomonas sp.]MDI1251931.1 hypothetical protein [Thermomonas sp.]
MTGMVSAGGLPKGPSIVMVGGLTGRFGSTVLVFSVAMSTDSFAGSSLSVARPSAGGDNTDGVPGFGMPVTEPPAASGWGRLSSLVCCCVVAVLSAPHAASVRQEQNIAAEKV